MVFEVIEPGNGATIVSSRVRNIPRRPVDPHLFIVEQNSIGLTLHRRHDADGWMTTALTAEDKLRLHDPEIEIPLAEFYENVDLPDPAGPPVRK